MFCWVILYTFSEGSCTQWEKSETLKFESSLPQYSDTFCWQLGVVDEASEKIFMTRSASAQKMILAPLLYIMYASDYLNAHEVFDAFILAVDATLHFINNIFGD